MRASFVFIFAALLLSGCAAVGGAVVVAGMAGDVNRYYGGGEGPEGMGLQKAPEADPTRKINVQDCSKPIEMNGGNLRCK